MVLSFFVHKLHYLLNGAGYRTDLKIRGGASRLLDKEVARSPEKNFSALRASVWIHHCLGGKIMQDIQKKRGKYNSNQ